jgi:hypothetical protein
LCLWLGQPARPRTQRGYHHNRKVKPEAATAVNELLMMGGRTTETCWAVNKRRDNKLENCCVWLVIYLNNMYIQQLLVFPFYYIVIDSHDTLCMRIYCCSTDLTYYLMYSFKTSPRVFLINKYILNARELFFIILISETITLTKQSYVTLFLNMLTEAIKQ